MAVAKTPCKAFEIFRVDGSDFSLDSERKLFKNTSFLLMVKQVICHSFFKFCVHVR